MKSFNRNLRNQIKDEFKSHTLKMVLTRLDFGPIFGFDGVASDFQKKFLASFPESNIEQEAGYDIDMSDFKEPKMFLRENHQTYALSNPIDKKKVKLSTQSLILEHHKYVDFNTFYSEFEGVGNFVFSEKKAVFTPLRLGLRKINSLVLDDFSDRSQFKGFFDERLTSYLDHPVLKNSLTVDRHFWSFQLDEDQVQVNLQLSSEKGKKQEKDSRRFVLDIDVFTTNLPKDFKDCLNQLKKMNDIIFDIFWSTISDKTETYLKSEVNE